MNNSNKKLLNSFLKPIFCDSCDHCELTITTNVVRKAHIDRIIIKLLKHRGYLSLPVAIARLLNCSSLDRAYCKECKCLFSVNLETCALDYLTFVGDAYLPDDVKHTNVSHE